MDKLIRSLGIILLGLALGYFIQILVRRKFLRLPNGLDELRKVLQKIAFLALDPIIYISTVWTVNLHEVRYTALPLLCLFGLLLGGTLAFLISRWRQMPRKQAGIYIIDGGITNLGTIGGLVTFTFLGEAGVALVSIYRLFEMFTYYSVAFPIAKSYSQETRESMGIWERIKQTARDPFVQVSLGSILVGFILNFSSLERPAFFADLNAVLIPLTALIFLSSVGMALRFSQVRRYLVEGSLLALIKFIIVPAAVTGLAFGLGFGRVDQGLPLKVVLILSSMPVGFTSLVPPTLYDLDLDFANANWLFTTYLLVLVIPLLQYLLRLL